MAPVMARRPGYRRAGLSTAQIAVLWHAVHMRPIRGVRCDSWPLDSAQGILEYGNGNPERPSWAASPEQLSDPLTTAKYVIKSLLDKSYLRHGKRKYGHALSYLATAAGRKVLAEVEALGEPIPVEITGSALQWHATAEPDTLYCPAMARHGWRGMIRLSGRWHWLLVRPDGVESGWIPSRSNTELGARLDAEATWGKYVKRARFSVDSPEEE